MAEPSTLIPNLNEIMEEHAQPEEEVHLEPTEEVHREPTEENRPSEQPEVRPVARQQKRKGKERRQEEEEDDFVSDEAYSIWKKHYASKGFVGERGFSQLISPFKELIEQRGWGKFASIIKLDMQELPGNSTPILSEERITRCSSEEFGSHMEPRT